jgi:hypothetical protein
MNTTAKPVVPRSPDNLAFSLFPASPSKRNIRRGIRGISRVYPKSVIIVFPGFKKSVFHLINMLNVYSGESPVDVDYYGYSNSCFRSGNCYNKQTKKESFEPVRIEETVKGKEIDIHRIQNQFNRHENTD